MMELGSKGKDKLTPLTGTIVGFARYLYGEDAVAIQPRGCTDDYKPAQLVWLPKDRVEEQK